MQDNEFPIGFFINMDESTKNQLLKGFIDLLMNEDVVLTGETPIAVRKAFNELVIACDKAVSESYEQAQQITDKANKANREKRRASPKTVEERAKESGLVVLKPNIPHGKLIY